MSRTRRIRIPIKVTTRVRVTSTRRVTLSAPLVSPTLVSAACPTCGVSLTAAVANPVRQITCTHCGQVVPLP